MNEQAYNTMYAYLRQHSCPTKDNLRVVGYTGVRDTQCICVWLAQKKDWEFYFDVLKDLEEKERCLREQKLRAEQTISIIEHPKNSPPALTPYGIVFYSNTQPGSVSSKISWSESAKSAVVTYPTVPSKK